MRVTVVGGGIGGLTAALSLGSAGIEVRVLEPRPPNRTILAGTVARRDADAARPLTSPGMRLRLMGVRCRLEGGRLAPLD